MPWICSYVLHSLLAGLKRMHNSFWLISSLWDDGLGCWRKNNPKQVVTWECIACLHSQTSYFLSYVFNSVWHKTAEVVGMNITIECSLPFSCPKTRLFRSKLRIPILLRQGTANDYRHYATLAALRYSQREFRLINPGLVFLASKDLQSLICWFDRDHWS